MAKPHLILLPGLLNDARLWRHQIDFLAEVAEVTVADLGRDDSLPALARRVLEAAPDRFALAGLSMGGYTALEIMRQAPGRVERLALLDTTARPDAPEQTERRRAMIEAVRQGRFAEVLDGLLPNLVLPGHAADPAFMADLRAMAERVGPQAFIRQQTAILRRPDSRPDLARIACPTLVLVGRQDALTPPAVAAEMASAMSDARLVVVEDAGHLSPLEQPHAVTAVLRYWLQV